MNATEQRQAAIILGNAKRVAVSEVRRQVRTGELPLTELLRNPPEVVLHLSIVDVVAWQYHKPYEGAWRSRLGRRAVSDGINLLLPIGRASVRTREWAALHAPKRYVRR